MDETDRMFGEGRMQRFHCFSDDILGRWDHMLAEFKTSDSHEFTKFSVALRELMLISHHCETTIN